MNIYTKFVLSFLCMAHIQTWWLIRPPTKPVRKKKCLSNETILGWIDMKVINTHSNWKMTTIWSVSFAAWVAWRQSWAANESNTARSVVKIFEVLEYIIHALRGAFFNMTTKLRISMMTFFVSPYFVITFSHINISCKMFKFTSSMQFFNQIENS